MLIQQSLFFYCMNKLFAIYYSFDFLFANIVTYLLNVNISDNQIASLEMTDYFAFSYSLNSMLKKGT